MNQSNKDMRTFTKLFLTGVFIMLFSSLHAQYRRGHGQRSNQVPNEVYSVTHHYPGYRWVGVHTYRHPRRPVYDVTLQRGRKIIELRVNRFGRVISKRVYRTHPNRRNRNVRVSEYWSAGQRNGRWDLYADRGWRNDRWRDRSRRVPPSERYNYRSN